MTNIRVLYNDTELFWESEDQKTCHKCGSSKHLISDCAEKESAENYKEYKNQFTNIYSKYKVPNYKNTGKRVSDNRPIQSKPTQNQNNKSTQSANNELQKMMENLIKSFTKDIEEKFNNITKQLSDVNNRIKLIEIKTGLDKPKIQPKTVSTKNNNTSKYSMSYFPTAADLEKNLQSNKEINDETEKSKQKLDNAASNNKRPLSESENSSGEDFNSKQNKDKNPHSTQSKPRRKSIRLYDNNNNNNESGKNSDEEINGIKLTQGKLEKEMSEIKEMFQQFTIQWYNTQQTNDGNGSSSTGFLK